VKFAGRARAAFNESRGSRTQAVIIIDSVS
jgi:hypothetical protein